MGLKSWYDVINLDLPCSIITEESRKLSMMHLGLSIRDNVRMAMGMYYTDHEYNCMREEILSSGLP